MKQVSFQKADIVQEDSQEIDNIGYIDANSKYVPNPHLKNYHPRITTMGAANRGSGGVLKPALKNQVSYDDILNSLNVKVVNGKLQISRSVSQIPATTQATEYNKTRQVRNMFQKNPPPTPNTPNVEQDAPLTKEEYQKVQRIQYINMMREQQRIAQIKSKKIQFSNAQNQNLAPVRTPIQNNHFFKLR